MLIDPTLGVIGAALLTSGGGAWFGVKAALNGTRDSVRRIEAKLDKAIETQQEHAIDIAVIKGERRKRPRDE